MDERGLVEKQGMGEFDGEGELNEKKRLQVAQILVAGNIYFPMVFLQRHVSYIAINTQYDFVTLMRSIFFEDGMEYTRIAKHFQETV